MTSTQAEKNASRLPGLCTRGLRPSDSGLRTISPPGSIRLLISFIKSLLNEAPPRSCSHRRSYLSRHDHIRSEDIVSCSPSSLRSSMLSDVPAATSPVTSASSPLDHPNRCPDTSGAHREPACSAGLTTYPLRTDTIPAQKPAGESSAPPSPLPSQKSTFTVSTGTTPPIASGRLSLAPSKGLPQPCVAFSPLRCIDSFLPYAFRPLPCHYSELLVVPNATVDD